MSTVKRVQAQLKVKLWRGSPWGLANVRGQQCALISYLRWGEPPKPTGEMWCFAPQNHSRFSMTALTVSVYQKWTRTFRFHPFTLKVTLESQQKFNHQLGFYFSKQNYSFFRSPPVWLTQLTAFISTTRSLRAATFSEWHRMERSWRTVIYRTVNFLPQAFPLAITAYTLRLTRGK